MTIRFPKEVSELRKLYQFNSNNLFTTTNPKTGKNSKPTLVLHFEPIKLGMCPAAGSCAALCLNKAGNPVYLENKLTRRQKRSKAFISHKKAFLQLMVLEAYRYRLKGYEGLRPNGTSDWAWEHESVEVTERISVLLNGLIEPGIHPLLGVFTKMGFEVYDYTKRIDRDFRKCAEMNYHLTLSWGGKHDDIVFDVAKEHGLNVAAPVYGIKKKSPLPEIIEHKGVSYPVIDGDVTDWRPGDPNTTTSIVGLRLKRTPGQTEELARRFCIM